MGAASGCAQVNDAHGHRSLWTLDGHIRAAVSGMVVLLGVNCRNHQVIGGCSKHASTVAAGVVISGDALVQRVDRRLGAQYHRQVNWIVNSLAACDPGTYDSQTGCQDGADQENTQSKGERTVKPFHFPEIYHPLRHTSVGSAA